MFVFMFLLTFNIAIEWKMDQWMFWNEVDDFVKSPEVEIHLVSQDKLWIKQVHTHLCASDILRVKIYEGSAQLSFNF